MSAMAVTRPLSRGVVEAVLQAFPNGGWSALLHGRIAMPKGAPSIGEQFGAIRPESEWDGRHFCVQDWHVILLAGIEGGDKTFTRRDAERLLGPATMTFTLDGEILTTERTAIHRMLNPELFGLEKAYAFQEGTILSPDELEVGDHTLSVVATEPGQPDFVNTIRFSIDAPDSDVCVSSRSTIVPTATLDSRQHDAIGVWRQTVTFDTGDKVKTVIAFTSDGVVHEINGPVPESSLGVWEKDGEDRFRATFLTYHHKTLDPGPLVSISRVRADFTLQDGHDRFRGCGTVDLLDPDEQPTGTTHLTEVDGVRMSVIRQARTCR